MARVQPDAQWVYLCGKGDDDGLPYVALVDTNGKLEVLSEASTIDAANVTYTPADVSDWDGGVDPGSQADADDQLASRVKTLENNTVGNLCPIRAHIPHRLDYVVTGNALALAIDTAQIDNNYHYQNVAANGDVFINSAVLKSGAYTISMLGLTNNNSGKLDVSFKHVSDVGYTNIATGLDWYSAATVRNNVKTATFNVVTSGRHIFKFTINGKNGSSGGYYLLYTCTDIYLTAGDS